MVCVGGSTAGRQTLLATMSSTLKLLMGHSSGTIHSLVRRCWAKALLQIGLSVLGLSFTTTSW
eukprot:4031551-Pleurochrysis_carterae.AAC.1